MLPTEGRNQRMNLVAWKRRHSKSDREPGFLWPWATLVFLCRPGKVSSALPPPPLSTARRRVCKSQTATTLAATRRLLRSMAMLYVCARAISPSHPESAEAINGAGGVASSVRLSSFGGRPSVRVQRRPIKSLSRRQTPSAPLSSVPSSFLFGCSIHSEGPAQTDTAAGRD